jgi:hypothetical protein
VEAFFNLINPIQPLQGCLTDIISRDKEDRCGQAIPVGVYQTISGQYDQPKHRSSRQDFDDSWMNMDHEFLSFRLLI